MHLLLRSLQKRPLKVARSFIFILGCVFYQQIHFKSSVWATLHHFWTILCRSITHRWAVRAGITADAWATPPAMSEYDQPHLLSNIHTYFGSWSVSTARAAAWILKSLNFWGRLIHKTSTIPHVKGLPALNMKAMIRYVKNCQYLQLMLRMYKDKWDFDSQQCNQFIFLFFYTKGKVNPEKSLVC